MTTARLFSRERRQDTSKEEECKLFTTWQELRVTNPRLSERMYNDIMVQYSPVVIYCVNKMSGYNMPRDDLTSEAYMALATAAKSYNPALGNRFFSYASKCVILTLYTYITKNFFITNVCGSNKNKRIFFGLRRALHDNLQYAQDTKLTTEVISSLAEKFDTTNEEITKMLSIINNPYNSLNEPIGSEEGSTLTKLDVLQDTHPLAEFSLGERELETLRKEVIAKALDTLDERTRYILNAQVLIDRKDRVTLDVLGNYFGISRERARQIRERGIKLVSEHINASLEDTTYSRHDLLQV